MKKYIKYIYGIVTLLVIVACEKNDPITELGVTNGQYAAQLRVTYNNTRPAIGDTLIITASTWQRDDKYSKVVFYETIFETFGLKFSLENGTVINTKEVEVNDITFPTLLITDTVKNKSVLRTIDASEMDSHWVTVSNSYAIREEYIFKKIDGDYPNNSELVDKLTAVEFDIVKSVLAYSITRDDYLALFPDAPSSHFTTGGTYVLTQEGINNLKANLSKAMLLPLISQLEKTGSYSVRIDVDAITPTGATTSTTRTFDNNI